MGCPGLSTLNPDKVGERYSLAECRQSSTFPADSISQPPSEEVRNNTNPPRHLLLLQMSRETFSARSKNLLARTAVEHTFSACDLHSFSSYVQSSAKRAKPEHHQLYLRHAVAYLQSWMCYSVMYIAEPNDRDTFDYWIDQNSIMALSACPTTDFVSIVYE